jgi:hypothetical protein
MASIQSERDFVAGLLNLDSFDVYIGDEIQIDLRSPAIIPNTFPVQQPEREGEDSCAGRSLSPKDVDFSELFGELPQVSPVGTPCTQPPELDSKTVLDLPRIPDTTLILYEDNAGNDDISSTENTTEQLPLYIHPMESLIDPCTALLPDEHLNFSLDGLDSIEELDFIMSGLQPVQQITKPYNFAEMPAIPSSSANWQNLSNSSPPEEVKIMEDFPCPVAALASRPRPFHKLTNKRGHRSDPKLYYQSLPAPPAPWGPIEQATGKPKFQYTRDGEWEGSITLNRDQLAHYISNKRGLRMYLQNPPPQHSHRYPSAQSSKCRWKGCPMKTRSILKGFWRVAFCEQGEGSGSVYDPFHNAGYMHLYCLERNFDLIDLLRYGLQPDVRIFSHEDRNAMALNRDHDSLLDEYIGWVSRQRVEYTNYHEDRKARGLGPKIRQTSAENKLWHALTRKLIALDTGCRARMRATRNGNSIDKHKGNVAVYANQKAQARTQEVRSEARGKALGQDTLESMELPEHGRSEPETETPQSPSGQPLSALMGRRISLCRAAKRPRAEDDECHPAIECPTSGRAIKKRKPMHLRVRTGREYKEKGAVKTPWDRSLRSHAISFVSAKTPRVRAGA